MLSEGCAARYSSSARRHGIRPTACFLELELPDDDHKGGRAHLARHVLRRELRRTTDLDGWYLPPGCTPNSELKLCRDTMTLKILRPGLRRGSVPHPGPNRARMYYYRNPKLNLYGADGSNLIGRMDNR
jgi:hypothetical protein